jgi:hypothetical protein
MSSGGATPRSALVTPTATKDRPGCGLDDLHPTPCFPSYPSAHASGSYAGRTIVEKIFDSKGHDITLSHPSIPDVILHYTNLSKITDDIDDARVFGGIHFRFDQEAGARQGRQVGTYVYKNNLQCCSNQQIDWVTIRLMNGLFL